MIDDQSHLQKVTLDLKSKLDKRSRLLAEIIPYFEATAKNNYFVYSFCERHQDIIREFKLEYEREQKTVTVNQLQSEEPRR
jgi:hypothetical protein